MARERAFIQLGLSSVFRMTYQGPCISWFSLSRVFITVSLDMKINRAIEDASSRMTNKKLPDSPQARAHWLLQFCQCDISELTDQDLGQLQNEWVEFQGDLWKGNHPPIQSTLVQWQQEVNGKINDLKNGLRWSLDCGLWRQLELVNGQLNAQQRAYTLSAGADNPLLFRVMNTLAMVSNDLRLCAREKCRVIFVRTKRQAYCSPRCRGTEGTQRYRKKKTSPPSTNPESQI